MPKTQIDLPKLFIHTFEIAVRVTDLNYGNHLANDKVQVYLQEARVDFLAKHNLSELNIGENTSLIQGDAAIIFKSEGFLANNILVELAVNDFSNSSFDIVYKLTNTTTAKDLAFAKTRMVCFNYEKRKVQPVPSTFINLVKDLK